LYRAAAERKHPLGQVCFGRALEKGIGVEVDKKRATNYYKNAADQGDAEGEFQYARCLEYGIGVPVGNRLASIYYKWAANEGFDGAEEGYMRCIAKMAAEGDVEAVDSKKEYIRPKKWKHITVDERRIDLRGFQMIQELESARNNIVQVLRNIRTSRMIVVKYYQLGAVWDACRFAAEADVLVNLYHPCILPIRGISAPGQGIGCGISTKFMENGSLDDVLYEVRNGNRPKFWTDTNIAAAIVGIVMGMRYLHMKGIIHCNLKPSNLLIDHLMQVKIADFATSKLEDMDAIAWNAEPDVTYMAPELNDEDYTSSVDVYSFGVILNEMVMSSTSLKMEDQWKVKETKTDIPTVASPIVRKLVNRCCSRDPKLRPSFKEIFSELEGAKWVILRDSDASAVAGYVRAITRWELEWIHVS
jgi:serine/threonine protein kinase